MRCFCPKCNAHLELDLENIPEEGSFNKCSQCNAGFLVKRVSFAQRALYKGNEITCAECGSSPGTAIFCQNCHAIYPDFYAAETSSAARKQVGKLFGFLGRFSGRPAKTSGKTIATDYGSADTQKVTGLKLSGVTTLLIVLLVAAIAGGYFWYTEDINTKYTDSYVRAIYGIKAATDLNLKTCMRISADWQKSMLPTPPQPTATELTYMQRADKDVGTLLELTKDAPEKFKVNSEDIAKLAEAYKKLHEFTAQPSGSIATYSATITQLEDEFKKSAGALKSRLPEKVSAKLAESKKKYKALEDF